MFNNLRISQVGLREYINVKILIYNLKLNRDESSPLSDLLIGNQMAHQLVQAVNNIKETLNQNKQSIKSTFQPLKMQQIKEYWTLRLSLAHVACYNCDNCTLYSPSIDRISGDSSVTNSHEAASGKFRCQQKSQDNRPPPPWLKLSRFRQIN